MKKILFLLLVFCCLSACSKRDAAYYEKHPDAAESTLNKCMVAFKKAIETGDESKFTTIQADCEAADEGQRNYKNKAAKLKAEQAQKEFDAEYQKERAGVQNVTFQQIAAEKKICVDSYDFSKSAKCKAIDSVYTEKEPQEMTALIAKYPGDSLRQYSETQCRGISYNQQNCDVAKKAYKKQFDDKVALYLANRDTLKTDFNASYTQLQALKKAKQWNAMMEYRRTFLYETTASAARQLKIYGDDKPIS